MKNTDDNILDLQSFVTARDINAQADAYKQFREHIKRMHKLQEEMIWKAQLIQQVDQHQLLRMQINDY